MKLGTHCKISVAMDNDAFTDLPSEELARILRFCATLAEEGETSAKLRDINGNTVGTFEVLL